MKQDDLDMRHLRYFLKVAQTLNFTRAAEQLGLQQPPLSLQIRQMEEAIGVRLFDRQPRGVTLTAAGEYWQTAAQQVTARLEEAIAEVRRRQLGKSGQLRLGFAGATYNHPAVPATIRAYRALRPAVELSSQQSNTPALLDDLRNGHLDAAFIRPPVTSGHQLSIHPFVTEETLLVLPSSHRAAKARKVDLTAIMDDELILFPRTFGPGLYDSIISACHTIGFSPNLGQSASQISSILPMVAAGFGVSVLPRSVASVPVPGTVCLPIAVGAPTASIVLAVRADDDSAQTANFVTCVSEASFSTEPASHIVEE